MITVLPTSSSGDLPYEASRRSLALASAAALVVALLILVLFVLPAERGIDLTGIGARLGLAQMRGGETAAPANASPSALVIAPQGKAEIAKATAMRADDMTLVVKPHTGVEVKAQMKTGDHLIFRWESTAPVKMDMHGEKPNAADGEFTRYWMESDMTGGQGAFTAPFDGRHGWYFRNRSEKDVTITVHTAGFYELLFQPKP